MSKENLTYFYDKDSYYDPFLDRIKVADDFFALNDFLEEFFELDTDDFEHRDAIYSFLEEKGFKILKKELTASVMEEVNSKQIRKEDYQ